MTPKDFLSIALVDSKLPNEAAILNECKSIADFVVKMQMSVSDSLKAISMAKDFSDSNLSHVARVITTVQGRDEFHAVYVGPSLESASRALQSFEFDVNAFHQWQEAQCVRIIDTWCHGSLMTSTHY